MESNRPVVMETALTGSRRVFISHTNADRELASKIYTQLKQAGHLPWMDRSDSRIGEVIGRELERQIVASDALVFLNSKATRGSTWQVREANWALSSWEKNRKPRVLVVNFDDGNTPLIELVSLTVIRWESDADTPEVAQRILKELALPPDSEPRETMHAPLLNVGAWQAVECQESFVSPSRSAGQTMMVCASDAPSPVPRWFASPLDTFHSPPKDWRVLVRFVSNPAELPSCQDELRGPGVFLVAFTGELVKYMLDDGGSWVRICGQVHSRIGHRIAALIEDPHAELAVRLLSGGADAVVPLSRLPDLEWIWQRLKYAPGTAHRALPPKWLENHSQIAVVGAGSWADGIQPWIGIACRQLPGEIATLLVNPGYEYELDWAWSQLDNVTAAVLVIPDDRPSDRHFASRESLTIRLWEHLKKHQIPMLCVGKWPRKWRAETLFWGYTCEVDLTVAVYEWLTGRWPWTSPSDEAAR